MEGHLQITKALLVFEELLAEGKIFFVCFLIIFLQLVEAVVQIFILSFELILDLFILSFCISDFLTQPHNLALLVLLDEGDIC